MSRNDPFPDDFASRIERRLSQPPPGRRALREWSPELSYGRHYGPPSHNAKAASVAALLYRFQSIWHVLLTVRSIRLVDHAGQVSLPGGAVDPGETDREAARRELEEELGVSGREVDLVGRLSSVYLFASNFLVVPWVAFSPGRPNLRPNPDEVAEVLEVPLTALVDRTSWGRADITRRGLRFASPHFLWKGHRVWGGTAMILGELLAVAGEVSGRGNDTG